jgi:hypothetical protein
LCKALDADPALLFRRQDLTEDLTTRAALLMFVGCPIL